MFSKKDAKTEKNKNINKQFQLIRDFYALINEDTILPVTFQNIETKLRNTQYINKRRYINDEPIVNGELLGTGGMKKVFYIDGKAVFLMGCQDINRLEQIINEEVSISHQLALLGLHTQALRKGSIGIYAPDDKSYHDYPCMFADSFSTLSIEKNIEVFDIKNLYRFGSKYKLYQSNEDYLDNSLNRKIFQDILDDIANVLYLGFDVNVSDSFNLAFMPSGRDSLASTVKLFLFDFSSKCYNPKLGPNPLKTLPDDSRIKSILKNIIWNVLEAEHAAKTGRVKVVTPKYIHTFFDKVYPEIEGEFISYIKSKITERLSTRKQFEERTMPFLFQSTQLIGACERFGFYNSSGEKPHRHKLERSNSCQF